MSSLNLNETTHATRFTMVEKRQQCLLMRVYFNSHYSAKLEQQEIILDHALSLKPNDVIVELGVCNGQTAAILARSCSYTGALYYGIDAFMLQCVDNDDENPTTREGIAQLQYLVERMDDLNLNGQLLFGKTQDIGKLWNSKRDAISSHLEIPGSIFADGGISLLFIDAGHDESNVKPDIDIWLPLLKPGGIVIFHDYDDPYDPQSPHWAVRHYADLASSSWERQITNSMLIARKPVPRSIIIKNLCAHGFEDGVNCMVCDTDGAAEAQGYNKPDIHQSSQDYNGGSDRVHINGNGI